MSLTAGYYRNTAGNWRVNDNIAIGPDDFDPFCATAPMDPRLPGGGGYEVCGLYDIKKDKRGQGQTLVSAADSFIAGNSAVTCGEQRSSRGTAPNAGKNCGTSDFIGISIDTRFSNGASLGGGFERVVRGVPIARHALERAAVGVAGAESVGVSERDRSVQLDRVDSADRAV